MQNFMEIQRRNLELLSSGGFRPPPPPPQLDRGMESPRLDRVKLMHGTERLKSVEVFHSLLVKDDQFVLSQKIKINMKILEC